MSVSILIADDHPVFRHGLRDILNQVDEFRVIGEAGDGETAYEMIRSRKPDVAVIDVEMPKLTGLELADRIHRERLPVALLVLTMYSEESIFDRAMELGVMGYIIKDSATDEIALAVRTVASGEYFVSRALVSHAIRKKKSDAPVDIALQLGQLTATERYVLRLIAHSRSTREIADILTISHRTVEGHRHKICQKLALTGSYSLLRFALDHKSLLEQSS